MPALSRGGLLDGFPRTVPQAETFDALPDAEGLILDAVLRTRWTSIT